jgi:hypothetical protein
MAEVEIIFMRQILSDIAVSTADLGTSMEYMM